MEKDIRKKFKNTIFYGIWNSRPFLCCYVAGKKKGQISNPVKNRVLESFSNIFFTLEPLIFLYLPFNEKLETKTSHSGLRQTNADFDGNLRLRYLAKGRKCGPFGSNFHWKLELLNHKVYNFSALMFKYQPQLSYFITGTQIKLFHTAARNNKRDRFGLSFYVYSHYSLGIRFNFGV